MEDRLKLLIERAATALKTAGAREVYVFGSVAKGAMHAASDVDIAVSGLPPEVFFKTLGIVEDILRRPVDLIELDDITPFTRYLKEEGELVRVG